MKKIISIFILAMLCCPIILHAKEFHGWIKSETCWVVKEPNIQSPIVGILSKQAAVTVEDGTSEFAKIIYAPVRNLLTGKFFKNSAGLYIQRKNISKDTPNKW